jgi:hypothetical protein
MEAMTTRTGMAWRRTPFGWTRQYHRVAGPITHMDHIMTEATRRMIMDELFRNSPLLTRLMREGSVKFEGGTHMQTPFFEVRK